MRGASKDIIGMIHVAALPTAPFGSSDINATLALALKDAKALEAGGIKKAIVENFFDTPYANDPDLETVIGMAYVLGYLKEKTALDLGVSVQATSGTEEMSIACICGLNFIRAESFVEMRMNSAGIMRNMCAQLLRKRRQLRSNVKVLADINVKHSYPVIEQSLEALVHEAIEAGADGIILTGMATGKSPSIEDAKQMRALVGKTKLYIGSGVNEGNIKDLLEFADGVIVGSSIKENGDVNKPVDPSRVKKLMAALT